ncbi:MAG: hypothetical protein Tsb0020_32200 [Haliangiales bacterium]
MPAARYRAPRRWALALLALLSLTAAATASADPRHASSGFFAEVGAGPVVFLPDASDSAEIGPAVELRFGYEPFSWLAVGAFASASTHEATVPPPPVGEYFQLFYGGADLRLSYLFGRVGVFVDGRVGISAISSNVLEKVEIIEPDEQFGLFYAAGAGVEYQIENRHYAFGLAGQWVTLADFDAIQAVTSRVYLRYTY